MQHAKNLRLPRFVQHLIKLIKLIFIVSNILYGIDLKMAFARCRRIDEYVQTFMDIFKSVWGASTVTVNNCRYRLLTKTIILKQIKRLVIKKRQI